jgi:hypothetical protein
MATDPRKRQRKLERRAGKRQEKKQLQVRERSAGLAVRLTAAARYPILDCTVSETLDTEGMGAVLLSRELPDGRVAVATFLVDRYCLGVKDAWGEILGHFAYDSKYRREMWSRDPVRPIPPADARKLVEQAAAYARRLGFAPHADYAKAAPLFGDIDPAAGAATFEFGKNGKPFFIAGPHDSPARCRQILATLEHACGKRAYEYFVPLAAAEEAHVLPAGDDDEEMELDFEDE